MSATTTDPIDTASPAAAYVAAVADALTGVPEPERQELLDDLADHLAELAAEDDGALDERLGAPETYAAELVASAGITVGPPGLPAPVPVWERAMDAGRRRLAGERAEAVRAFLPELRPGWWVLRGWAVVALLTIMTNGDADVFPIPQVIGNSLVSLVALVAACVASVRIGRRRGWVDGVATTLGVIGLLLAALQGDRTVYQDDQSYPYGYGALTAPDGRTITNIWPYDGDGQPLDGVLLFDQEGLPIDLPNETGSGQIPIPGLFPQVQTVHEYDPVTGVEREVLVTPPSVVVPNLPTGTPTIDGATSTTEVPAAGS